MSQKHGRLAVRESCADAARRGLLRTRFFEYLVYERDVVLVLLRILERFEYLAVVDELFRVH